ncbi:MAG: pyrroline-5-carboxylate reductase [Gammaproteobacteria bacterium]|nr:pyrroline-5-carboxylate reductase [Gammaproteobacteria bacterium]
MASSLIGGLLRQGFDAAHIHVADPDSGQLNRLIQRFKVHGFAENKAAVEGAQAVLFAVKPQVFRDAALPLASILSRNRPLIISIAAGVPMKDIGRWLGYPAAVVRVMPNTPALIGAGAAALCANQSVSEKQRTLAQKIFDAVGLALWIENEEDMNAVTAVSGSGPAYFFLIMEIMQDAARELGLPADVAGSLVRQTAYGAVRMAIESRDDLATLKKRVTSPGGTTAAALKILDSEALRKLFLQALTAARDRGSEISAGFGKEQS